MSSSITASISCRPDGSAEGVDPAASPCLSCGACCASFRVGFYWAEADDAPGGWVPVRWTTAIGSHRRAMLGTDCKTPRCAALQGAVGESVSCAIYAQRSSTCREFDWRGADGGIDARCTDARSRWGLPPLG
jgi:Fe-S-cluster containining protein